MYPWHLKKKFLLLKKEEDSSPQTRVDISKCISFTCHQVGALHC